MIRLLTFTAVLEAATGLALIVAPSVVVRLLVGGEVSSASTSLGRFAGLALLALGLACWPSRDAVDRTKTSLRAMLTYNSLATIYFIYVGSRGEWNGPLLWPAVALHGVLSLMLARQCWQRNN